MVTIRRPGRDATLIAWGRTVNDCLAVAEAWGRRGVEVEVLEVGGPVLLDDAGVLASVARTRNAVLVGGAPELACRIHEELFAELEHAVQRVGPANGRADVDAALRRVLT
jgi:pyruvate/2-oxoglutarate/acetoin dehydrogenase E1 component